MEEMLEIQKEIEGSLGEYDLFKNGHIEPLYSDDIPPKTTGTLLTFENDSHYLSIEDWEDEDYSIYFENKRMILGEKIVSRSKLIPTLKDYARMFNF